MNKQAGKEEIKMLNTTMVVIGVAFGIVLIGYLFTIAIPLLSIVRGGYKVIKIKWAERKLGKEELIAFHKKLGFTMADGGERKKEEKK
jgi:hypothetical protein